MQAVSRLYGRRIRGDIGPLNLDPARRLPGRIIGPAVSLTGYLQDYEEATNVQNFTLGSRMQLVGSRVFYYARVNAVPNIVGGIPTAAIVPDFAVKNPLFQTVIFAPIPAAYVVPPTQIVVTVAITDGVLANGAIGLNELVGGHIVIFAAGLVNAINREVIANTATLAGGGPMTVTLDRPCPIPLGAGSRCEIMASEYSAVQTNDQWNAVVGIAMLAATTLQYIWLQTWGPVWENAQLTVGEGLVRPNNRQVVFRADGSLGLHVVDAGVPPAEALDPTVLYAQHAGYIMNFAPGFGQGAPFLFLQITP